MDLDLKEKVVIVTGGSSGIGSAIYLGLRSEGAKPIIFDRTPPDEKVTIQSKSHPLSFIKTELNNVEACGEALSRVVSVYGKIDGLVNNAGFNDGVGLEKAPEAFRQSLENNLIHYFTMTHLAAPHLKKTSGAIVNISSKTAVTGQGNSSGYCAAKGAQLSLTREWAIALLKDGVRVNAIVPAEVATPMYEKWIETFDHPQKKWDEIVNKIPLGNRMTRSDEIANMCVFLLSPASSHTTGQWIFVDGGYTHLDRALL